jgi:hypothetical protein
LAINVTPSAPVGTLLDDSVYRLEVKIDETEIGRWPKVKPPASRSTPSPAGLAG